MPPYPGGPRRLGVWTCLEPGSSRVLKSSELRSFAVRGLAPKLGLGRAERAKGGPGEKANKVGF